MSPASKETAGAPLNSKVRTAISCCSCYQYSITCTQLPVATTEGSNGSTSTAGSSAQSLTRDSSIFEIGADETLWNPDKVLIVIFRYLVLTADHFECYRHGMADISFLLKRSSDQCVHRSPNICSYSISLFQETTSDSEFRRILEDWVTKQDSPLTPDEQAQSDRWLKAAGGRRAFSFSTVLVFSLNDSWMQITLHWILLLWMRQ